MVQSYVMQETRYVYIRAPVYGLYNTKRGKMRTDIVQSELVLDMYKHKEVLQKVIRGWI